jgi:transcriptional regulator of acetoin/glycerol metabolism
MRSEEANHIDYINAVLSGNLPKGNLSPESNIVESWLRCVQNYDLDPSKFKRPLILSQTELKDFQQPLEKFLWIARAGLENLYRQLSCLNYVVVLADANGVNIDFLANKDFSKELKESGLYLGSVWTEEAEGTNGVGTCLELQTPLIVHRAEHFKARHIHLSCTVSPIFSPEGKLIAVLDASSLSPQNNKESQFLVLQLVKQTAKLIEKALFFDSFKSHYLLNICERKEFAQVITENLVALDDSGKILAADKNAKLHLTSRFDEVVVGRNLKEFCHLSLEDFLGNSHDRHSLVLPIRLRSDGHQYYASLTLPEKPTTKVPVREILPEAEPAEFFESKQPGVLGLDALAGTDPHLVQNVHYIKRVMNKGIPIMLLGETGTGKEAFAQAIHNGSNRAKMPFIALNCASIPETLIESELFGYSEGAFTGAKQKGMKGKILQSDGGTLFLDEIGDMPAQLQTRLLRVLAEKEIMPLGGGDPVAVDLHVICATHRNLSELVQAGRFREDLYYRLNGITLNLPAVRERSDKGSLIYSAFKAEAGHAYSKTRIGEDAWEVLLAYHWPGNIRQLRNVLRYALAVNESGVISVFELPPEIMGQSKEMNSSAPLATRYGSSFKLRTEMTEKIDHQCIETA